MIFKSSVLKFHYLQEQSASSSSVAAVPVAGAAALPISDAHAPPPPDPTSSNAQSSLVARFQQASRLQAEWAHKCLAENDFDYDQAWRAFSSLRAQIPPEAFMA
jgi:nuclear RNA export factor